LAAAYLADGGYAGPKLKTALAGLGRSPFEIVKRSDPAAGFHVSPHRWVVERTFTWLGRYRRRAKDFEATIASSAAWLYLASIQLLARRLAIPQLLDTQPISHNHYRFVVRH
jgi:putative transposase